MGAVSSIIFAKRNVDKTVNGDIGRAPIPAFQLLGATAGVATLAQNAGFTKLSNGMNSVFSASDNLLKKVNINASSQAICANAGKLVNPLLCGASAIRVLRDEDKGSALVEEGFAMGSMFAGEKIVKKTTEAIKKSIQNSSPAVVKADLASCKTLAQNFSLKNAQTALKTISNTKTGKVGGAIIADLVLVTASIFCFGLGKKLGKKITGRDKKEQVSQVQNITKQPTKAQAKELAVKA